LHDAYFMESKVIRDNRSLDYYINGGLNKFTNGDYAWAMPNAMMVGYVRNNACLPDSLEAGYSHYDPKNSTALMGQILPCYQSVSLYPENPTYLSIHERSWMHPSHGSPSKIEIAHLWLNCQG